MNLFYLDSEYSNGNFYLGDIFELAVIAEKSGNVFHTFITIPTPLDSHVQFMCNITDNYLQTHGLSFKQAFASMICFINSETKEEEGPAIIMAHNGFYCDFPLLLTNCIKNKCDIAVMSKYCFIDTFAILQQAARDGTHDLPHRLSLKALSENVFGHTDISRHTAGDDATTLMMIFQHDPYRTILIDNINNNKNNRYNTNTITWHLNNKMPIPIVKLYRLARGVTSPQRLSLLLTTYVREKTAFNKANVNKIALYYFHNTSVF